MKLRMLIVFFLSSVLLACDKEADRQKKPLNSYRVQASTLHKALHFTGIIQPLRESVLTTPMDAEVKIMHYHYGQTVKKGQVVFTLNSAELQHQYNETLTEYLKSKDNYSIARAKFSGTEELWKAGLLSKNNYLSEKSSLTTEHVALMQSSRKLSELIEKTESGKHDKFSNLSFSNFAKVRLALNSKHNLIQIKSPRDGVLLYPPKSDNDTKRRVNTGMSIKSGQILGIIGELSGIRVEINIPEVDMAEIKTGMLATVRGIAFGKHTLRGKLVAVNAQASTNSSGLPSFTAIVEVHGLSKEQQALIKVGMSSEIELSLDSRDKLLIPILAIQSTTGKNLVNVLAKDGKMITRSVVTGAVNADKVVIDSGLNLGDVVIYE